MSDVPTAGTEFVSIYADDHARCRQLSRRHLRIQLQEIVTTAIEAFEKLPVDLREKRIRTSQEGRVVRATKNVRLFSEPIALAKQIAGEFGIPIVQVVSAAILHFSRLSDAVRKEIFRAQYSKQTVPA